MLQTGAGSVPLYVLLFVQAVIVAPVGEELFFRGIMQPYLTERPWGGLLGLGLAAFIGTLVHWPGHVAINDPAGVVSAAAPALFVLAVLPLYWRVDAWVPPRWLPVHDPIARRQAARAIVGTAILFANVHANVWPTPVPLFVLALGLGWLAYRTQGVVAPIVLHMLFNAIPILAMPRPVG
jgi:membrane protease YdiL (CAAX protease family)